MKTSTSNVDLFKLHKADYAAGDAPGWVTPAAADYLTITGRGDPDGDDFAARTAALFAVAYAIRAAHKAAGRIFIVPKLEGLWWGSSVTADFSAEPRATWNWTLLLRMPDFVRGADVGPARTTAVRKGKGALVNEVGWERISEGTCVQMLHVGPWTAEAPTLAKMNAAAAARGLKQCGRHHEIYLSDPRRVAPEQLKTILRHPVA